MVNLPQVPLQGGVTTIAVARTSQNSDAAARRISLTVEKSRGPCSAARSGAIVLPASPKCATGGSAMDDFPIEPPLVVKDTPKPRRLTTLAQARAYVDEAMRLGRPAPWRELWHRLKSVNTEDDAIE